MCMGMMMGIWRAMRVGCYFYVDNGGDLEGNEDEEQGRVCINTPSCYLLQAHLTGGERR